MDVDAISPIKRTPIISADDFVERFANRLITQSFLNEDFDLSNDLSDVTDKENLIEIDIQNFDNPRINGLVKTFKVYDPGKVLMRNGDFALNASTSVRNGNVTARKAGSGTCTVGIYECKGKKVCFKHWPEAPTVEIGSGRTYRAANRIYQEMQLPGSEVILMGGQVFLVSEFIEGKSLREILQEISERPTEASQYTFNLDRFQRVTMACIITLPEDCCPQNIIVRKIPGSAEYEPVLIDSERSFGQAVTKTVWHPVLGWIQTRVHCSLFCFHEMLGQPISEGNYSWVIDDRLVREAHDVTFELDVIDRCHMTFLKRIALLKKAVSNEEEILEEIKASHKHLKPKEIELINEKLALYKNLILYKKVVDKKVEWKVTMLGIPNQSIEVLKGIPTRFGKIIKLLRKSKSKGTYLSLKEVIIKIEPKIAELYKFNKDDSWLKSLCCCNPNAIQPEPTSEPELIKVLHRINEIEPHRFCGSTPPSANVALLTYFASTPISNTAENPAIKQLRSEFKKLEDKLKEEKIEPAQVAIKALDLIIFSLSSFPFHNSHCLQLFPRQ